MVNATVNAPFFGLLRAVGCDWYAKVVLGLENLWFDRMNRAIIRGEGVYCIYLIEEADANCFRRAKSADVISSTCVCSCV